MVTVTASGQLEDGDDGLRLWPDGDPFPRWPQDYPPTRSDAGAGYEARLAAAEALKAYGNEAFAAGDFARAEAKYAKALRYATKRYTREAEVVLVRRPACCRCTKAVIIMHAAAAAATGGRYPDNACPARPHQSLA